MTNKIFVALSTFAEHGEEPLYLLRNSGVPFALNSSGRRLREDEIVPFCADATGLIAGLEPYTRETIQQLPLLRCISRAGVGTDNIDLGWTEQQGIDVRNTPNVVVQPVVELTLAMILALLRKLVMHSCLLSSGNWQKHVGANLSEKTVGVIGVGRIGKKVCETIKSLGAKVIAHDICVNNKWAKDFGIEFVGIQQLLAQSDILTLHVSSEAGSGLVLGESEFSQMKKGVIIVNTARGFLIEEAALCQAIEHGTVSGVGLDVFPTEPYDGPLARYPNVVLTPHIGTLTAESRLEMEIEATQNLLSSLTANE